MTAVEIDKKRKEHIDKFMFVESSQIPLTQISDAEMKYNMIDPTTGKPYTGGLIMKGCFADLSNNENNNRRFYDIPQYLEMVKILKKQINSTKGIHGELEHPEGYGVNSNNISHKILDIWYDEATQHVMGVILVLNTPKGRIVQDIIKSGSQIAMSARAAGEQHDNPDGTTMNFIKLLTTYDIVYHPGFNAALMDFVKLNESQMFMLNKRKIAAEQKTGFTGIIMENQFESMNESYNSFIGNTTVGTDCFYEWYFKNMNESQQQQKQQQQKLQKNEIEEKDELQSKLETASNKDLKESFFCQINKNIKQRKKEGASYYDGSAGFIKD